MSDKHFKRSLKSTTARAANLSLSSTSQLMKSCRHPVAPFRLVLLQIVRGRNIEFSHVSRRNSTSAKRADAQRRDRTRVSLYSPAAQGRGHVHSRMPCCPGSPLFDAFVNFSPFEGRDDANGDRPKGRLAAPGRC